jgi:hypothetical protein
MNDHWMLRVFREQRGFQVEWIHGPNESGGVVFLAVEIDNCSATVPDHDRNSDVSVLVRPSHNRVGSNWERHGLGKLVTL